MVRRECRAGQPPESLFAHRGPEQASKDRMIGGCQASHWQRRKLQIQRGEGGRNPAM